ncbi:MAG TPA: transketolase [Syntrophorhabdaceae bacterium]|jgi:transketolase|nr:transketolase [Syntrophorhabdaceae bacterium]HOS05276.1 transketolase [Syntrophorhabdaceae bacterium]HPL40345.1 transketolase [Syntrophorhabdaceae bacterium]
MMNDIGLLRMLKEKAGWIRAETLNIHKNAPETRLASSLSAVEIFAVLYYGGILSYNAKDIRWDKRDRFIISKGHGSISLYPVLADLGFFQKEEIQKVCKQGSFLGGIPDASIPGYETINGSLGHGVGVACGISLALQKRNKQESVFVLMGDGELYEGSVWEAFMFAGEHKLENLNVIVDSNKASMLGYCRDIIDFDPLGKKLNSFRWKVFNVDGHDIAKLFDTLTKMKKTRKGNPKILIADTVKGKGVPRLENDPLSHIKSLTPEEVDSIIERFFG